MRYLIQENRIVQIDEFQEFKKYINLYEKDLLTELDMPSWIKDKFKFVQEMASILKTDVKVLFGLFKNSKVYKFFASIKWSLSYLYELIQTGLKTYRNVLDAISEFIAKNKVVQWTTEKLGELDEFIKKHPKTAKVAGIAVAGLLIYIWFKMTFTGDPSYDFDMETILLAFSGKFSLAQIFGGKDGVKLLLLLTTGIIGIGFPWPSSQSIQFVGSVVYSLAKMFKQKIPSMNFKK